jgi:hypothetical protein
MKYFSTQWTRIKKLAFATCITQIIELLKGNLVRRVEGRSRPQPARKNQPQPHLAYKG